MLKSADEPTGLCKIRHIRTNSRGGSDEHFQCEKKLSTVKDSEQQKASTYRAICARTVTMERFKVPISVTKDFYKNCNIQKVRQ